MKKTRGRKSRATVPLNDTYTQYRYSIYCTYTKAENNIHNNNDRYDAVVQRMIFIQYLGGGITVYGNEVIFRAKSRSTSAVHISNCIRKEIDPIKILRCNGNTF
jgi:hypothetical protein